MDTPPYGAIVAGVIAFLGLIFLVLGATSAIRIRPAWYRYASGVGLAALGASLFSRGEMTTDPSTVLGKIDAVAEWIMVPAPVLLVVETGGFVYFGFQGPLRYVGLGLLILGIIVSASWAISGWFLQR